MDWLTQKSPMVSPTRRTTRQFLAGVCTACLLATIAPVLQFAFPVPGALAEQKKPPTKETMIRRCNQKALTCEQDCDRKQLAGDLSDAQYKTCNDKCESRVKKCIRRVEELRPERTTGGGDPGGDGGLLLSPD